MGNSIALKQNSYYIVVALVHTSSRTIGSYIPKKIMVQVNLS